MPGSPTEIAFVLPSFAAGGAERVAINLAASLDRERFAPMLIVLSAEGALAEAVPPGLPVVALGRPRLRRALPTLLATLRRRRPSVVVSTLGYVSLGLLALRAALPRGTRIVVREANLPSLSLPNAPYPAATRLSYRLLYRRADLVLCSSARMAAEFRARFAVPEARLRTLPNPVDERAIRAAAAQPLRAPGAGPRFVAAGRLTRQKGFDLLIDWFRDLPGASCLTILGTGHDEIALRRQASSLGLEDRVRFAGQVANPWAAMAGADAFVLPSRWEGLPNVVLEALASGTPVIATPESGGIAEIAEAAPPGAVTVAAPGPPFVAAMRAVAPARPDRLRESLLPARYRVASVAAALCRADRMCGLAGLIDFAGLARDAVAPRLDAALERLAPRGPDGEGRWFDARAALGHRRLAIVDLSDAGAQPMVRNERAIVFNGMIYNYRALRDELRAAGHEFASDTDTEVLLAGWAEWDAKLLPRLNGMFAFALWDAPKAELVLARDRFGQKPMFYRHDGTRIAFASQLHALQRLSDSSAIDPAALRLYLALRYLPEPWSILDGVGKLPPGHIARFTGTGPSVTRWYDLAGARPARATDAAAARAGLVARFDAAVADRLVADVPVGAFLSGGIDSALVAASMVRASPQVRTFTVGFEGAAGYYEERPAARAMARHLGTAHCEIAVSAAETARVLDRVFDALDEPFADSSAIPAWILARETRRHVTVALSGDGADEAFGGYRKYQGELLAARYRALPGAMRCAAERFVALLPEGKGSRLLEASRRARRFLAHAGADAAGRQAAWARNLTEAELDALLVAPAMGPTVESLVEELRAAAQDDDPVNAMLVADIGLVLPGDMLVKADRATMAHALELRCPFLDHRVVEWAAAMPGPMKLARGQGKKILREAFADRLPSDAFRRPKRGFEIPIADWLTGPLAERVRQAIDPAFLRGQGLFRPELPARWLAELESGRRDTSWQLWTLVAFQAWAARQVR